jgi:arsenate reductase
VLQKLNLAPQDIIRKGEAVYKVNYKGKELSEEQWLQILVDNPILIERPIVIKDQQAVIGRPTDNIAALL